MGQTAQSRRRSGIVAPASRWGMDRRLAASSAAITICPVYNSQKLDFLSGVNLVWDDINNVWGLCLTEAHVIVFIVVTNYFCTVSVLYFQSIMEVVISVCGEDVLESSLFLRSREHLEQVRSCEAKKAWLSLVFIIV